MLSEQDERGSVVIDFGFGVSLRCWWLFQFRPARGVSGSVVVMLSIHFNVGFTEVVPIVGGERGEGAYNYLSASDTVTARMISRIKMS